MNMTITVPSRMPNFDMGDMRDMCNQIGDRVVNSIQHNFDAGGRPRRWPAKNTGEPSHLFKSGRLMRSVDYKVHPEADGVLIYFEAFGPIYAGVHQTGGGNNIPARPYMIIQDDDILWIKRRIAEEIYTRLAGIK